MELGFIFINIKNFILDFWESFFLIYLEDNFLYVFFFLKKKLCYLYDFL